MSDVLFTKEDIIRLLTEADEYVAANIHIARRGDWILALNKVQSLLINLERERLKQVQMELMEEYRAEQAYQRQEPY